MAWAPGDPWPGTPGGASSSWWADNLRLYVWAAISAGSTMKWGVAATDRLDMGNVWSAGTASVGPPAPSGRLWIDLSCDVLALETHLGGTKADGALARSEAATARLVLIDPSRQYDPLNPNGPWQFQGRSRLLPGTPLRVWAEVVKPGASTVTTYNMHTGTVDTWSAPWEPRPNSRRVTVVSSDAVKDLVSLDWGEQVAVGAGDTVAQRIERILTYYGWTGTRVLDASTVTEQSTTLAQSAWELVGRATDDEVGFTFIDADGKLQFRNRATWSTAPAPVMTVGCPSGYDVIVDAQVIASSLDIRNAAYASRTGGTTQSAKSTASIAQYGEHGYKRTDLGLQTDPLAAQWAQFVVTLQGWPRPRLDTITLRPSMDQAVFPSLLGLKLVTDRVRVRWKPPDGTPEVDTTGRAFGVEHTIDRFTWETDVHLALADVYSRVMHWGIHLQDRLTAGNVYR